MAITKRDYYEILGLVRTATDQDLKSAYRRLAHQYHPDKTFGDAESEEKFKEAAEAYAVLSDPEQRQRYDRFGHAGVSSAAGAAWGAPGFGNIEDILGDLFGFGDVFSGGQPPRSQPLRSLGPFRRSPFGRATRRGPALRSGNNFGASRRGNDRATANSQAGKLRDLQRLGRG